MCLFMKAIQSHRGPYARKLLSSGPSMSMETAVRGGRAVARPAPSAAGSLGSGGRAASGIKVTLRGAASMAPAVSQGTAAVTHRTCLSMAIQ